MAISRQPPPRAARRRIFVRGIVQGVGFRPFVYRLARSLELAGVVRNEPGGVAIEVAGAEAELEAFLARLAAEAPPLARIEALESEELAAATELLQEFTIEASTPGAEHTTAVPPDIGVCAACLAEMANPADRRYRYPFINCTDCGPRFTVITGLPYDRAATTLRGFALCADCDAEYRDPATRRFHAEPIACPRCGPRLSFRLGAGCNTHLSGEEALAAGLAVLEAGGILAVKGVGGFHLACLAGSEEAVARLRERKGRKAKPFAVMMASLEVVRRYARVSGDAGAPAVTAGGGAAVRALCRSCLERFGGGSCPFFAALRPIAVTVAHRLPQPQERLPPGSCSPASNFRVGSDPLFGRNRRRQRAVPGSTRVAASSASAAATAVDPRSHRQDGS